MQTISTYTRMIQIQTLQTDGIIASRSCVRDISGEAGGDRDRDFRDFEID